MGDTDVLVSNVRRLQNQGALINRLPSIILAKIFRHMQGSFTYLSYRGRGSVSPWRVVGEVCQHWREVSLHSPNLWQQIHIPVCAEQRQNERVTLHLERSGVLPLSVYIRAYQWAGFSWDSPQVRGILSQAHRIKDLHLPSADSSALAHFADHDATQLENFLVLFSGDSDDNRDLPLFNGWRTPRLRSLVACRYTGWRSSRFGSLQNLALERQQFDLDGFKRFLDVLSANSTLEALKLDGIALVHNGSNIHDFGKSLSPVHMPKLKRLRVFCTNPYQDNWGGGSIFDPGTPTESMAALLSSKLVLYPGCAQKFAFKWPASAPPLDSLNWCAVHTLYLGDNSASNGLVMGFDEYSGFRVAGCSKSPHHLLTHSIPIHLVKELHIEMGVSVTAAPVSDIPQNVTTGVVRGWNWLTGRNRTPQPEVIFSPEWSSIMSQMRDVKKLVLGFDISSWLDMLSSSTELLPALAELHLLTQNRDDELSISQFLASRKRRGKRLRELRFIETGRGDAYYRWKTYNPWRSEKRVDEVVFEDYADVVYPLLKLPLVCQTADFAVPSYWDSPGKWTVHYH